MMIQASDLWALKLLSPDFTTTLEKTGVDLKNLSQVIIDIKIKNLSSEIDKIEKIVHTGMHIINQLENTLILLSYYHKI